MNFFICNYNYTCITFVCSRFCVCGAHFVTACHLSLSLTHWHYCTLSLYDSIVGFMYRGVVTCMDGIYILCSFTFCILTLFAAVFFSHFYNWPFFLNCACAAAILVLFLQYLGVASFSVCACAVHTSGRRELFGYLYQILWSVLWTFYLT